MTFRDWLVSRSEPLLRLLARQPRWLTAAIAAGLLLGGLFGPGVVGAALLFVLVIGLAWLLVLSEPSLNTVQRAIRLAVIGALTAVAITKLT